jgi:hypothetical protein
MFDEQEKMLPELEQQVEAIQSVDLVESVMHRWRRPHQFNNGLASAVAEQKFNSAPGNT